MRTRHSYSVLIDVRSPVLCAGLTPAGLGVDSSFIRDENRAPIIPSDHLKGLLRECWTGDCVDLFGSEPDSGTLTPKRGHVFVSDFAVQKKRSRGETTWGDFEESNNTTTRIHINPETGTADSGGLQVIELIAPYDDELRFSGRIVIHSDFDPEGSLKNALQKISAVGANRSIGFGEISKITLALEGGTPNQNTPLTEWFELSVDRPLMVGTQMLEENVFHSDDIIPGGAIKGMLANALERGGKMSKPVGEALSKMRISHAFPITKEGIRHGLPAPLSIVSVGDRFQDILRDSITDDVPLYNVDWKPRHYSSLSPQLGNVIDQQMTRIQRTRTKIDANGTASDSSLFVYHSTPSRHSCGTFRKWRFTVQPQTDPNTASIILDTLVGELDGLGKTDAIASISPTKSFASGYVKNAVEPSALVLLTPALMIDPDDVGAMAKSEQYSNYWKKVFDEPGLQVETMATETLAGGYQAKRFRRGSSALYRPWLLTSPGAVFRFSGEFDQQKLLSFIDRGLPKPAYAADLNWQNCPFLSENGHGEVCFLPDLSKPSGDD